MSRLSSILAAARSSLREALQKERFLRVAALGSPTVWKCLHGSNSKPTEGKCKHATLRQCSGSNSCPFLSLAWRGEAPPFKNPKPPLQSLPFPLMLASYHAMGAGSSGTHTLPSGSQPTSHKASPGTPVRKRLSGLRPRPRNLSF